jgi:hypothetical protein
VIGIAGTRSRQNMGHVMGFGIKNAIAIATVLEYKTMKTH